MAKQTTGPKQASRRNPVARHANTFNRSSIQQDRKAALKRGKIKHKGKGFDLIIQRLLGY